MASASSNECEYWERTRNKLLPSFNFFWIKFWILSSDQNMYLYLGGLKFKLIVQLSVDSVSNLWLAIKLRNDGKYATGSEYFLYIWWNINGIYRYELEYKNLSGYNCSPSDCNKLDLVKWNLVYDNFANMNSKLNKYFNYS